MGEETIHESTTMRYSLQRKESQVVILQSIWRVGLQYVCVYWKQHPRNFDKPT